MARYEALDKSTPGAVSQQALEGVTPAGKRFCGQADLAVEEPADPVVGPRDLLEPFLRIDDRNDLFRRVMHEPGTDFRVQGLERAEKNSAAVGIVRGAVLDDEVRRLLPAEARLDRALALELF